MWVGGFVLSPLSFFYSLYVYFYADISILGSILDETTLGRFDRKHAQTLFIVRSSFWLGSLSKHVFKKYPNVN